MTKISVSNITVVTEDRGVTKCVENLFTIVLVSKVGNDKTKKLYISILNKTGIGMSHMITNCKSLIFF